MQQLATNDTPHLNLHDYLAGRSYVLPTDDECLATPLSDDLIFNWSMEAEETVPTVNVDRLAWDLRRLLGDKRGLEIFRPIAEAWSDAAPKEMWADADRPRCETDQFVLHELAALHNRDQLTDLILPDEGQATVRKEVETLVDRFDTLNFAIIKQAFESHSASKSKGRSLDHLRRQFAVFAQDQFARDMKSGRIPMPSNTNVLPFPGAEAAPTSTELRDRRVDAASLEGKLVPDREWLVRDLIPAKNVTLLYGDGGTGKSLLTLQLAAAVVTGRSFFSHPVTQGSVEFVTAEDSLDEMHRRLVDVSRASGVQLGALSGLHLTSLAETDAMLAVAPDGRGGALALTALYHELESVIAESRPALVALDTLADMFGGNEVIRSQARQFIGMLRRLCLRYDCAIVVLAHPSLAGMEKGTSGSTGWNNSVRSRLYFTRVHDEKDGREANEDARLLRVSKSNYGRVGLEIQMQWRAGVFAAAIGTGGDPMVTAAKAERVFLELLAKFAEQNRYVSVSEGKSYAPFVFRNEAAKYGVTKSALKIAMEGLLARKRIENAPHGAPSKKQFRLFATPLPTAANGMPTPANAA